MNQGTTIGFRVLGEGVTFIKGTYFEIYTYIYMYAEYLGVIYCETPFR